MNNNEQACKDGRLVHTLFELQQAESQQRNGFDFSAKKK